MLQDKVSCFLEELKSYLDPTVLTICMVPCNMIQDQNVMNMNERVRHIKDIDSAKEKHPDSKAARCRKSDGEFPATELIFERHPVR